MSTILDAIRQNNPSYPGVIHDFVYVENLNLVVCFVSKNASSFLKHYLRGLARGETSLAPPKRNPHILEVTGFKSAAELGETRFNKLLEDDAIPKMIVGRNPYARLESAYFTRVNRFLRESYNSQDMDKGWIRLRQQVLGFAKNSHASSLSEALRQDIKYEDLVNFVDATANHLLDRHLVPQTHFAAVEYIKYDIVGRVEAIQDTLFQISEMVGVPVLDGSDLYVNSRTVNATRNESYKPEFTEFRERIFQRYKRDFSFFKYDKGF